MKWQTLNLSFESVSWIPVLLTLAYLTYSVTQYPTISWFVSLLKDAEFLEELLSDAKI